MKSSQSLLLFLFWSSSRLDAVRALRCSFLVNAGSDLGITCFLFCLHLEPHQSLNQQFLDCGPRTPGCSWGPSFPTTYLCDISVWWRPHFHQTRYHNRLKAEADGRIQLSFIKPDIKEICKNATLLTIFFCFGKHSYFSEKILFMLCDGLLFLCLNELIYTYF